MAHPARAALPGQPRRAAAGAIRYSATLRGFETAAAADWLAGMRPVAGSFFGYVYLTRHADCCRYACSFGDGASPP